MAGGNFMGAVRRPEDMSAVGFLQVFLQADGDVCLLVQSESGQPADVEFCSSGGRSHTALAALKILFYAMIFDQRRDESERGELRMPESMQKAIDREGLVERLRPHVEYLVERLSGGKCGVEFRAVTKPDLPAPESPSADS